MLAGGTFLTILMNQGLLEPSCLLSLRDVPGLDGIGVDGGLRLGRDGAPSRGRALVGGAQPAGRRSQMHSRSSPARACAIRRPSGVCLPTPTTRRIPRRCCAHFGARAVVRSVAGEREIPIARVDHRLLRDGARPGRADRRRPRSTSRRSSRRTASFAPAPTRTARVCRSPPSRSAGDTAVVVGAVAGPTSDLPGALRASKTAADIGHAYAEAIDPISDVRGSAAYRRRVIAVEVRRAVEGLSRLT